MNQPDDSLGYEQRALSVKIMQALKGVLPKGLNQDLTCFIRGGEITGMEFKGKVVLKT